MKEQSTRDGIGVPRAKRWPLVLAISAALLGAGAAQAQPRPSGGKSQPAAQSTDAQLKVNINTATEEELNLLPGIGPSKARAILELRKRIGKFEKIESLLRVRGIGRKTLRRLAPMLSLQGQSSPVPKKPKARNNSDKRPAAAGDAKP